MSNYAFLEKYIPLVEFMAEICGKHYEIILHDTSTPERSVIAARNAHLSGRRVGDPMTELAKELIREKNMNFTQIADYLGYTSIHYFSRQFKKIAGMTPSEYASSIKALSER